VLAELRALSLPESEGETRLVVGLISFSHFVNHSYIMLLPPVLTLLSGEFHVTIAQLGLAIGVQAAVTVALQLPYGYVADSYSREAVLATSLVVGAVGTFLTAAAPSYLWLLASQAVLGVGIAGHHPSHYPMISSATDADQRGRAYSLHGFLGSLGFATPPAVVTLVLALGGTWREALAAIGVVGSLFAVGCLWVVHRRVSAAVRLPDRSDSPTLIARRPLGDRFVGAVRALAAMPGILGLALLALLTSMAGWAIRAYAPILFQAYGLSAGGANLLVSVMLVVSALLILAGGVLADRLPVRRILVAGYVALAVLSVALASQSLPLVVMVLVAVPFIGAVSVSRPARSKLTDALAGRGDVGKSFALVTIGISGGGVVAPPAFGYVVDTVGVGVAFDLVAVLAVASILLTLTLPSAGDDRGRDGPTAADD